MKTILLKLSGPMQSWGTNSHFNIRHTDDLPSKSGVVGMIAACLGLRRKDSDKIDGLYKKLHFSVLPVKEGRVSYDFQTAQGYKGSGEEDPKKKYVTRRYFLEDASFIVAVGSADEKLIDELSYALQHPYFQPYLGRRGYVPEMDYYVGAEKCTPEEALEKYRKGEKEKLCLFHR